MNTLQMTQRPTRMQEQPARASINSRNLIDCHADEHLLVGTHSTEPSSQPVCLTCQLDLPLSA